jgi:carboxymethylenebutenolidase
MANTIPLKIGTIATAALMKMPAGSGPFPGVVVTFHKDGLDEFTNWLVDDLAANGFIAIAPNHFHILPPGKGPDDRKDYIADEQMALDLKAAAEWLGAQKNVAGKRYGLLGHCMGGRTTWVGLETNPELWGAGCVWYGGGALKAQGKAYPAPSERLAAIACPVAGFFGNDDKNPSPADVNLFDERLTKLGKPHEFHRYDGAGHAFMNKFGPKYREAACKDSWAKGFAFMRKHLAAVTV